MKGRILASVAVALLAGPMATQALTIFDITGTGRACTGAPDVGAATCVDTSFTGIVSIDVNPSGPTPPDYHTDGSTWAQDDTDWVTTTFQIFWDGGSYASTHVPGVETTFDTLGQVNNNAGQLVQDVLQSRWYSDQLVQDQTGSYRSLVLNSAYLNRVGDASWLSSVEFIESAGLAPGADALNIIRYVVYRADCAPDLQGTVGCAYVGYYGDVYLDSMVARTSVPEPGTLGLLGLGLAGLGIARRRKLR